MLDAITGINPALGDFCKTHKIWHATAKNCLLRVASIDEHAELLGQADIDSPALVIPHFDISGTQTGHLRTYALSNAGNSDRRKPIYRSKAGPSPNFYLCPIVDWKRVGFDPKIAIGIVIGELNAIKCCQEGLPSIAYIGDLRSCNKAAIKAAVDSEFHFFSSER